MVCMVLGGWILIYREEVRILTLLDVVTNDFGLLQNAAILAITAGLATLLLGIVGCMAAHGKQKCLYVLVGLGFLLLLLFVVVVFFLGGGVVSFFLSFFLSFFFFFSFFLSLLVYLSLCCIFLPVCLPVFLSFYLFLLSFFDKMIIMIIALKDSIPVSIFTPHCATTCLQRVCLSGQGAIVCKSRATHRTHLTRNISYATWYEGTAQQISLPECKSHLFLLHCIG